MLELRPYQRECLRSIYAAYKAGRRRLLVSLPTGTGKTVVFSAFPRFFRMKRRLLVLAHREELLEQARHKFSLANPELRVEIEQAARHASDDAQVVIASVPTLGRAASQRLARLRREDFFLVVVDEAHHAVADSYVRIFDHFGLREPDTPRMLVGFTATPHRGDGAGLGAVFEDIVFRRDLRSMIRERFLCRIRGWRIVTDVDLDAVKVRHGDFVESQLAAAVNVEVRNESVVKAYQDFAPGRRAVIFCADVAHARAMAAAFLAAGVSAAAVWGAMPSHERHATLAAFSTGAISVLANCMVLTEGFDEPRVDCVMLARPTKSQLLYVQMVGRGTRLHPDKQDLMVIDVVDNSRKHRLAGLHHVFDLPETLELRGGDALAVADELEAIGERYPWLDLRRVASADELRIAAQRIDFMELEPPEELRDTTAYAWCSTPTGGYRLPLPEGEELVIQRNLLDEWELLHHRAPETVTQLSRHQLLAVAIRTGDRLVREQRPEAVRLVDMRQPWREQPPTEKQVMVLRRREIPVPQGLTRGGASWIIALGGRR
ncbi:DEAD/DEAH box helicase [Paraliomyxa miuraensis]|uniref:DEAD/DEAH box helicase n=1 Tax=Paraliomyxa miuraensis TaxID=376150 RepID=UPI002258977A|nr:DEAD/DEAH box helicase [Paraliomyxa miuraensis]MCX4241795.1 DEAD/DEAH box helicase [Paraliomyxa miuraensis]